MRLSKIESRPRNNSLKEKYEYRYYMVGANGQVAHNRSLKASKAPLKS